MGAVLRGLITGNPLFQVRAGRGKVAEPEQSFSHCPVGFGEKVRRLDTLGEAEELLSQFTRRLQLCPQNIKLPQPLQHWSELERLFALPAQVPCPGVGPFHLGGGEAVHGP